MLVCILDFLAKLRPPTVTHDHFSAILNLVYTLGGGCRGVRELIHRRLPGLAVLSGSLVGRLEVRENPTVNPEILLRLFCNIGQLPKQRLHPFKVLDRNLLFGLLLQRSKEADRVILSNGGLVRIDDDLFSVPRLLLAAHGEAPLHELR